ncbi:GNAT family N-acetyltransferase [Bernardetia sp.]|uniref:GNAT family N-acetyltransferase n=1 Tax=Bernardetia sp. TaxID=1937974 RepID=UPI0025B8CAD2|nr:GNAT family N-acetyltransferase [Bernardetia sp.]
MKINNLNKINFDELIECFLLSFENYFVKMPTDAEYYKRRWQTAKVDYRLSYGMFDNNKLVGFIIHAIDKRDGKLVAYNTGTGVIPSHRGQKIVHSIYEYAISDLRKNGVEKCILEVITENTKAIKAYQTVGFEITKCYKCFAGETNFENQIIDKTKTHIKKVNYSDINWLEMPNQNNYSWDNHFKTIKNGDYDYYQIWNEKNLESFFIINPKNGYIAQFDILIDEETYKNLAYQRLFSAIKKISPFIKVNNIDTKFEDKINFLSSMGIKNNIDQYEMEMNLY